MLQAIKGQMHGLVMHVGIHHGHHLHHGIHLGVPYVVFLVSILFATIMAHEKFCMLLWMGEPCLHPREGGGAAAVCVTNS